jgi:superfamily II DNA/RNA helicase
VGTALQRNGIATGILHGDRSQRQRQRSLDGLRDGQLDVVVATEVAARGLHVEAIRTVVNYDVPLSAEEYVHRVGRAGHGGGAGAAITFVADRERDGWNAIARRLELHLPDEPVAGFAPKPAGVRRGAAAGSAGRGPASGPGGQRTDRSPEGAGRRGEPRRGRRGATKGRGRNRRGRPIGRKERPGRGVRRPGEGGRPDA